MILWRQAKPEDINAPDTMLRALSSELDDKHVATIQTWRQAGFGELVRTITLPGRILIQRKIR